MAGTATGQSGLASRYATALFELADQAAALDPVAEDLRKIKGLIEDSADLRRLLRSPVISRDEQRRALAAILEQAEVSDLTRKFVGLVATNRRSFALEGMIDAYLGELARRRGEMTADVVSANKLTAAQTAALIDRLKQVLGAKVSVNLKVDPALMGGMIVKVGSRMVDSSLRTKLTKLQLAMKGLA